MYVIIIVLAICQPSYSHKPLVMDYLSRAWIKPEELRSKPLQERYLVCGVRSSTIVHFEWYKNRTLLPNITPERDIEINDVPPESIGNPFKPLYRSLLRFLSTSFDNSGNYSCVVHAIGHEKQTVNTIVLITNNQAIIEDAKWKEQQIPFLIVIGVVIISLLTGLLVVIGCSIYKPKK